MPVAGCCAEPNTETLMSLEVASKAPSQLPVCYCLETERLLESTALN